MNRNRLHYKIQRLYYRLGGSGSAVGIIQKMPRVVHVPRGQVYTTTMLQFNPKRVENYPLFMQPSLYLADPRRFEEGCDVLVKGALYRDYGIVWEARSV